MPKTAVLFLKLTRFIKKLIVQGTVQVGFVTLKKSGSAELTQQKFFLFDIFILRNNRLLGYDKYDLCLKKKKKNLQCISATQTEPSELDCSLTIRYKKTSK